MRATDIIVENILVEPVHTSHEKFASDKFFNIIDAKTGKRIGRVIANSKGVYATLGGDAGTDISAYSRGSIVDKLKSYFDTDQGNMTLVKAKKAVGLHENAIVFLR